MQLAKMSRDDARACPPPSWQASKIPRPFFITCALDVRCWTLDVCQLLPTPMPGTFELIIAVLPSDIDAQNHVNNTVYLRWVQEVAAAHWESLAPLEAQEKIGWLVVRHEIDYKAPATLGDEVLLRTWVGKATRATFERFTEIRRKMDQHLLSQARTLWCPIDSRTGRVTRVPDDVRAQFSTL